MKWKYLLPILALLAAACSEEVSAPSSDRPPAWKTETLQPGMTISFPENYEGDGYWCGFDACYFTKSRSDGSASFSFALGPMTGNIPAEFDELPDLFCYPHRELITTDEGLEGALFYAWDSENACKKAAGTFVIEKEERNGFIEVVWLLFDDSRLSHVSSVLRTVKYADAAGMTEPGLRAASGKDLSASAGPGARRFFPLDMGNRWTYLGEMMIIMEGGISSAINFVEKRSIIGTEELFGRTYVLEEQVTTDDFHGDTTTYWIRYRQDRAGLYQADVAAADPPGEDEAGVLSASRGADVRRERWDGLCLRISAAIPPEEIDAFRLASDRLYRKLQLIDMALDHRGPAARAHGGPPGGVLADEITRLRYPLHPGQEWIIRDVPLFWSVVEEHDVLDLPAGRTGGFKISVFTELSDPNDVVFLWYGRDGFLKEFMHVETEMVDMSGNPLGTMIVETNLILAKLELIR